MRMCMMFAAMLGLMVTPSRAKTALGGKQIEKTTFGKTPEGESVDLYVLTNESGAQVSITNYGGIVVSLKVRDKAGKLGDVVLGYDSIDGYVKDPAYMGAVIGRYGNRIAHGKFSIDGVTFTLAKNNGENSIHGGLKGFNKVIWEAKPLTAKDGPALELNYKSKDGEEGYPGNLSVTVVYTLTNRNELKIEYSATTDKKTVVNLTSHSYFNLTGSGANEVLGHVLTLNAGEFTPVDAGLIPTGELRKVLGTPFDFRQPVAIGARIGRDDGQLKLGKGYDHNFVLGKKKQGDLGLAARVTEPASGRVMEVWTTEPGVQLYSGNSLDGTIHGKGGQVYLRRSGFCLETQHFPDSPNQASFPSTLLKPAEQYHTITVYKFSAK